jgi:hypothetical protein
VNIIAIVNISVHLRAHAPSGLQVLVSLAIKPHQESCLICYVYFGT